MRASLSLRAVLFGLVALGVCATAFALGGRLGGLPDPAAVAAGVTLDLTVLVPGAYYALVVRPRGWSSAAVAPVVVAGVLVAALTLPVDNRGTLRLVEAIVVPAEAALVGWLAWRVARALRVARSSAASDPVAQLYASVRAAVPTGTAVLAGVLAAELAVLYYALGAWRARPHVPPGAQPFTTHRRSGHGALVVALLMLTVVEGLAVHLLLARWYPTMGWAVTALSAYGALWLVADHRATVLRPMLWDGSEVWLRAGLRWRARVPRGYLTRVSRTPLPGAGQAQSLAFLTTPNLWIECAAPVVLEGPYGLRREVTHVGLFVDEPGRLAAALADRPAA